MKLLILILLIGAVLQSKISNSVPENNYKLVFEDNFEFFDYKKWNYEISRRHLAVNTPEAIRVENSNLTIHPYTENNQYFSGIVNTRNKFEVSKNSYIEIRAKFNDLPGTWSCFWLYNDLAGLNEENVLNNGAEIDIFEHRNYDSNNKDISGYLNHTIHWNGYDKFHKVLATDTGDLKLNDNQFHIISLTWDENGYQFRVDGKNTWKINEPKTNAGLFLVISTEIGYIPFWVQPPPKIISQPTLTVDYVKVWQKVDF